MKRNRFYLIVALMLALSWVLAACGDPTATTAPTTTAAPATAAKTATAAPATTTVAATTAVATTTAAATTAASSNTSPLVVGMIVSRTGALSIYGKMLEDSWPIGMEYYTKGTNKINGRDIKLVVEDDGSDANKAVEAARKLVQQDKAEVLVGIQGSAAALAVATVNEKELKKVLIIDVAADPSITGTAFSRYTFRTGRNTDQDALAGATLAVDIASKKNKKIASFFQDTAFGQGGNASWKQQATKTAGITWTEIAVPSAATDFTPYVQKLLDAAPDVFILNWAGTTTPKLAQTLKDNDVFSKMTLVSAIADSKVSIKSLGDAAVGFQGASVYWHQFPKNAENDYLVKAYKDKYNTFPDFFDPGGMNIVSALSTALAKTNGDADPEKLIPAMEGMSYLAPKGKLTFRKEDHQTLQPMYLVELKKDTTGTFPFAVPSLIKELSAEEAAPPIRRKS